jgi:hypothetical protein
MRILSLTAATITLAACSSSAAAPSAPAPLPVVHGTVTVPSGAGTYDPSKPGDPLSATGHPCQASDTHPDIADGAQITADVGDTTVGVGTLGVGTIATPGLCSFTFSFTVTKDAPIYDVTIALHPAAAFTKDQLAQPLALSLS